MDYEGLVERLRNETYWLGGSEPYSHDVHPTICDEAAEVITDLIARVEAAEARAEKAERERDAAIKMLRKIEWCNGCKNFRGLQGCRIGALVTCNPQNDMYVFGKGEE